MERPKVAGEMGEELQRLWSRLARIQGQIAATDDKVASQTISLVVDDEDLGKRMRLVERRLEKIEEGIRGLSRGGEPAQSPPVFGVQHMLGRVGNLQERLDQMEKENRNLAQLCERLREQNEAISNLYVAKHRLHATFESREVMQIVMEILVELVGRRSSGSCSRIRRGRCSSSSPARAWRSASRWTLFRSGRA